MCSRLLKLNRKRKRLDEKFAAGKNLIFGKQQNKDVSKIHNGNAIVLPKPVYPDKARSQRLTGTVMVEVEIDKFGNIVKAKVACGNPILASAAEAAAWKARFEPTLKNGKCQSRCSG